MICEVCVRNSELEEVVIEGSLLMVCGKCRGFGVVVKRELPRISTTTLHPKREEIVESLVEGYNLLIRLNREKKGLKQEELAKYIGEKGSVIAAAESGRIKPSLSVAKKLESFLGVRLLENNFSDTAEEKRIEFKNERLTLGDLMKKE